MISPAQLTKIWNIKTFRTEKNLFIIINILNVKSTHLTEIIILNEIKWIQGQSACLPTLRDSNLFLNLVFYLLLPLFFRNMICFRRSCYFFNPSRKYESSNDQSQEISVGGATICSEFFAFLLNTVVSPKQIPDHILIHWTNILRLLYLVKGPHNKHLILLYLFCINKFFAITNLNCAFYLLIYYKTCLIQLFSK